MSRTCTGRIASGVRPRAPSRSRRSDAMKPVRIIVAVSAAAALAAVAGSAWWVRSLGPVRSLADVELSTQVVDRNGGLLRAYATSDGRWRLPATVSDVDPRFVEMLQTYEDR